MEANVQQKTEALARALADSEAYKKVVSAREEVESREAAKVMLRDLLGKQQTIQQKLMQGQQPTEAEVASYQQTANLVSANPYIRTLMDAEMQFNEMMVSVQQQLAEAVGLSVEDPNADDGDEEIMLEPVQKQPSEPKSRLWVPGQE